MQKMAELPKAQLAYLPTPLDNAERLAAEIGLKTLYIKRDDATGLAMGGNKARKLEYLLGQAALDGCDVVITTGGAQSNHARITAAAARKLGMHPILILKKRGIYENKGNILLDRIFGSEIHLIDTNDYNEIYKIMDDIEKDLMEKGKKVAKIPVGGSTPLGSLGYVQCAVELFKQTEDKGFVPDYIFCASGSGGTQAGLILGTKLLGYETKIIGVMVSPEKDFDKTIFEICEGGAKILGVKNPVTMEDIILKDYIGEGYGIPSENGQNAIKLLAKTEGILVDPVYSGKALGGLIDMVKRGEISPESKCIFINTGGTPALFAYGWEE